MKKQKHDGGFVAMSVGAGLLIVLVMASMAARYMGDYLKSREWQVVAMQTNRFTQAATSYVGRYYPTVLASATTTTPVVVTTQMLKNTGLLPASFSETNSYGQQYQAMIVRNQQNQALLQGMVVSRGGHAMPFTALNQISKDITAGFGGYVEDGQTAVGAMRSWRIALSSYGTSTGRGHLAVLLSTDDLSGAREDGDRLYRFQVNGRPDLNKMHTAIDMGGNNLNNAGTVAAQNGNFGVSLVSNGPVTAGGDIRSTGGWIVTRSGKGWMDETHGGGFYMSDNDWVRSVNNKGIYTGGQVKGGSVRSDSDLAAGGILKLDQVNVAGTWCPQNGAISHDSTGGILSCQSGRWGGIDNYPVGSPIPWPSTTPPPGYFLMAGQRFPCGSYPQLARAYPGCVLPDLRGVFIRGLDNGRGFDSGRAVLSYQADQSDMVYNPGGALKGHHSGMAHYYHSDNREVRPKNIAFNYIVKAG
ncbi:shufflon system plasmid conjugative transfer pilus tip adhesin PilV [Salmonella enterica]|nr:shufflon system plasmid conjugative transfer pilus tip adhesin PilV [Salmonella enterica]ECX6827055.1 shufflon system plasmid conjugative transfer pilus tip adhesin PilV [Salmonella enterica subsp. enterica serovar Brandenburg]EHD3318811.1 shufflon system plasmid conjugative transfer pilus tip adhesin PilV [Salmonella enterica subsp. enterica serovar Emek]EBF1868732.1 shufflon system plasmid conjugative transfer pilus tip adhesin PilV [Salmonella enterica]EBP9113435.1 shufflon system plasmid